MAFDNGVSSPGGMSYAAPLMQFQQFANWKADDPFQKVFNDQQQQLNQQRIQQGQQQLDLSKTFQGGLPRDAQGNIDYSQVAAALAQKGDIAALTQMAPLVAQQQAGNTPLLPAGGQGGGAAPAPPPMRPSATNSPQGDPGSGTVASLVTDRLPNQDTTTGQTIAKIAQVIGVDPNATLTSGQLRRAQGLLQKYAAADAGGGQGGNPDFKDRFAGDSGSLPPSANAVSPKPQVAPQPPAPIGAGSPQQPQGGPPAQAGPAPQPPQGPITPQVPLPPGFTDPQQAAMALRQRAAQIESANPKTKPKADELRDWASRIEASIAPVDVSPNTTRVDPRTGKILYQGPGAAGMANNRETGATLEADAENYRQTGKLPPNMGRGIQGQAESNAIRQRAAEMEIGEGGNPADWSSRWQSFATQAAGKRALETRAAGLSLAENEASSLIPRVREISSKISRTNYPSLNSLILAAQKGTGGTDVIKLGIAIESLVPVYARVLKPVGQVGQGDMARAHDILDKAWSDGQIGAALDQMQVELKSARSALDKTMTESENRRIGKKQDDTKTSAPDTEGWVDKGAGVRIREVK